MYVDIWADKFQYLGSGLLDFDESRLVGKVVRWEIKFDSLPVYILPLVDTAKQNV
jgi:hypothetical protein